MADLPHDFSASTLEVWEATDVVLLVVSPEIASVRAASIALETYKQLNYPEEKIKVVLNWTFEREGLAHEAIENALHAPIQLVIPYGGRTLPSPPPWSTLNNAKPSFDISSRLGQKSL